MKDIEDLIQKHQLLYMIIAKDDGSILDSFGNRSGLKYMGVLQEYFGNKERIVSTGKFLQGKQLPQIVKQKEQCCLLTLLDDSIVLGVFFLDDSDVFVRKKRLKVIYDDILGLKNFRNIDMSEIFSKVEELCICPLRGEYTELSVSLNEKLAKLTLPDDYKRFVSRFSVTSVFDKEICFFCKESSPSSEEGKELLEVLFADCDDENNDLLKLRETYLEELPSNLFIIAEVTGGNLLCLELSDNLNAVKLWDKSSAGSVNDNLYLVADSFSDFILMLTEDVEDSKNNKPQLQSVLLSNDLKTKATEFLKKQKDLKDENN